MPKSVSSFRSFVSRPSGSEDDDETTRDRQAEATRNAEYNSHTAPTSPAATRHHSTRTSDIDLRGRMPPREPLNESSTLLHPERDGLPSSYRTMSASVPATPRMGLSRRNSYAHSMRIRQPSRRGSLARKISRVLGTDSATDRHDSLQDTPSAFKDDRVWYDQFTSTDWVHDSISDAYRVKELRSRKDWRGRLNTFFDGAQGWILVAIIGCLTAAIAYVVDELESTIFDYKTGYCSTKWHYGKRKCCSGASVCDEWKRWSALVGAQGDGKLWGDFAAFVIWVCVLSVIACLVTLQTKTTISSAISISTLDENLGAETRRSQGKTNEEQDEEVSPTRRFNEATKRPPMVYYPAAGSGVAEVKVILSGFVLHGYLGVRTLVFKAVGLVFSVGSGLSVGKEGPYVHLATCIGNIASRMFGKYSHNDGKRREVLSASAAAGVAVAFGAPIGGVLFSLEEVSYYFPPKTLFRTLWCCIVAALSLRFLNPYGTGKIVLFEVRYLTDWRLFEMIAFISLGIMGGATGALFIKASRFWATTFRRVPAIKKYPIVEVLLVAIVTGVVSFWNRYTRIPVAELLYELASPCDSFSNTGSGLCPTTERIPDIIGYLCWAFIVKAILTTVTFGIKVPAGIYVPSMVVGGLLGRIVGHCVQWLVLTFPDFALFSECPANGSPESCVVPGVYALVAAGATMCGVTRLSVTLAVILFELTGSLEHVLPFSLGVLIAKWTADALEPLSIYDLLTDMNSYPYLDSKVRPVFTTELGDITPHPNPHHYIDITDSPLVPARHLRIKLEYLHMSGELDGGLPILRNAILVGLIPAPDLEFALDRLEGEEDTLCMMGTQDRWRGPDHHEYRDDLDGAADMEDDDLTMADESVPFARHARASPTDLTPYIDPAPVVLDICSPMDLVFECFVKLGLRYICVLREGKYVGLVHKKAFVRYVKETHEAETKH